MSRRKAETPEQPYTGDIEYAPYSPVPEAITPSESKAESVRPPRLYVKDECIERCRSLSQVAANALLKNTLNPTFQEDVLCLGKSLLGCNARTLNTGQYTRYVNSGEEVFLENPARYTGGFYGTVSDMLNQASEQGITPHDITELK